MSYNATSNALVRVIMEAGDGASLLVNHSNNHARTSMTARRVTTPDSGGTQGVVAQGMSVTEGTIEEFQKKSTPMLEAQSNDTDK